MKRHKARVHVRQKSLSATVPPNSNAFIHPFTMVISGPTGCGKSFWLKCLLSSNMIQPPPERIIFMYKRWQPLYEDMYEVVSPKVEFIPEIPRDLDSDDYIDPNTRNIIIIDDLMTTASKDRRITNLFCEGSHHRNLSVVSLNQNLYFGQDPTQRRNTQYMVLFKNPIDKLPVMTLAKQMYPTQTGQLIKPFEEATQKPYGHIVIDLKLHTSEDARLRANIFDTNKSEPGDILTDPNQPDEPPADRKVDEPSDVPAGDDSSQDEDDASQDEDRQDDDRCFLLLMSEAKKINNDLWFTKYNTLRKMGHTEKEAITHAWDLMVPHDKTIFLELYETLLLKVLLLWRDYRHHKIFSTALSLLRNKNELEACKEAVQRYKHLFDVAELQLKSTDEEETGGVILSGSVEY